MYRRAGLSRTMTLAVALLWAAVSTGAAAREFRTADTQNEDYPTVQALDFMGRLIAERTAGRVSPMTFWNQAAEAPLPPHRCNNSCHLLQHQAPEVAPPHHPPGSPVALKQSSVVAGSPGGSAVLDEASSPDSSATTGTEFQMSVVMRRAAWDIEAASLTEQPAHSFLHRVGDAAVDAARSSRRRCAARANNNSARGT